MMAVLSGAEVAMETADGLTKLTGPVAAFKDAEGWWAGLITTANSVPPKAAVIGHRVQIRAEGVLASACVSDRVDLIAETPTVQLLMRGDGPAPF